jgi:hypothetical protein
MATALALPVVAVAQGSRADIAYCAALSEKYVRYVGHAEDTPRATRLRGSLDAQVAVASCQRDSATAIPVLEQALTKAKIDLPPRG